jgi:ABC-type transport system involved in multi-copper enzyme maturation permease subunit
MKVIYQILGIACTEFRFGFRRGGPVVGMLAISLVVSGSTLFLAYGNKKADELIGNSYIGSGANMLAMAWPGYLWLTLVVLPLVCASAIPSDRQLRVQELLTSLPLTAWSYLAGKILGVWAILAFVGCFALLAHIGLHIALIGPVNWELYLRLTLLCGLPLTFWASALGILIGSILPTRRAALIAGLLIGLVSIFPFGLAFRTIPDYRSFQTPGYTPQGAGVFTLLTHQATSDYVFQQFLLIDPDLIPLVTELQIIQVLASALLTLAVGFLLARTWLARKENF